MSTYSFQPICPAWVIAMWALACLGIMLHAWRRTAETLPTHIRRTLIALRLGALLLLAAFLLRPWRQTTTPQSGASRVVVLLDASASMFDHQDAPGHRRRWDAAVDALPAHFPWPAEALRFSDQGLLACPAKLAEATALPGETALGKAVDDALASRQRPGALPLAALILISDGAETAPASSLIDAAKNARSLKIPVSTFCLGTSENSPNASITWEHRHLNIPKDEPFRLVAKATNGFPEAIAAVLTILDNSGQLLTKQDVILPSSETTSYSFDLPALDRVGDHAFTIRLTGQGNDARPSDDSDTAIIHVEAPPHHKLLYLAANPGWEWRFLRTVAEHSPDLSISAIIRIGQSDEMNAALPADFRPARLYHRFQLPDSPEERGFPGEASEYADFDGVILDCSAAAQFTDAQCAALISFVERKGGGLLLVGNPEFLPGPLSRVLPARNFAPRQASAQNHLAVSPDLFFTPETAKRLNDRTAALPPNTRYLVAQTPKRAARVAMQDTVGDALLVAQGNFGAGRVAWLGLQESWRWCLAPEATDGLALHREFWSALIDWLGHNRQPVLRPELPTGEIAVGQPVTLAAWVTGPDFLPAPAAQVQARIQLPNQATQFFTLSPSTDELGLYQVDFIPEAPGAYTVDFTAQPTPEAMAVTTQTLVVARDLSREAQESAANPELLADVARMTGGKVLQTASDWSDIPLSADIPQNITRKYLLENFPYALLLILLWTTQWWLRRRHGMK